jgi:hypothetical protein
MYIIGAAQYLFLLSSDTPACFSREATAPELLWSKVTYLGCSKMHGIHKLRINN